jgi:hypothetical protein
MGVPHPGQVAADDEISRLHSGQWINDMRASLYMELKVPGL